MTTTISNFHIQSVLAKTVFFEQLPPSALQELATKCQLLRYRIGQPLLVREKMPTQVLVIYQGTARLIGYDHRQQSPVSLGLVEPKTVLGWAGLIRNIPCETAIASTEVICITIPAADFLASLSAEPTFAHHVEAQFSPAELCELLSLELQRRADSATKLKDLVFQLSPSVEVLNLAPGQADRTQLHGDRTWLISSGEEAIVGNRLKVNGSAPIIAAPGVRLLGVELKAEGRGQKAEVIHPSDFLGAASYISPPAQEIPYAPEQPPSLVPENANRCVDGLLPNVVSIFGRSVATGYGAAGVGKPAEISRNDFSTKLWGDRGDVGDERPISPSPYQGDRAN